MVSTQVDYGKRFLKQLRDGASAMSLSRLFHCGTDLITIMIIVCVSFVAASQLYSSLMQDHDLGRKFLEAVSRREGVEKLGGMSDTSAEGTTHSVLIEEQIAFANWINWSVNTMHYNRTTVSYLSSHPLICETVRNQTSAEMIIEPLQIGVVR